jgi:hypothetical protein
MCVICVLRLIVVPLPPGKNTFAVKINNNSETQIPYRKADSCSVDQEIQGRL